jgi:NAD kinase
MALDKIVVVTKKTALEELVERFGSRGQAAFYLEHAGLSFEDYEKGHEAYEGALAALRRALPSGVKSQFIERSFLPSFLFGDHDLVVTLGPDGLVVNTAKYVGSQPILPFNPDPARVDGILIPFRVGEAAARVHEVLTGARGTIPVSMVRARLDDGQELHAFNDLFVGSRTHVSARWKIAVDGKTEEQSSSGLIVSTGAGSTGWWSSVVAGSAAVSALMGGVHAEPPVTRRPWTDETLAWVVREPFTSRTSAATLVCGFLAKGKTLRLESKMPENGVIFGDGVERDYLPFGSGAVATIALAERKTHLVSAAPLA